STSGWSGGESGTGFARTARTREKVRIAMNDRERLHSRVSDRVESRPSAISTQDRGARRVVELGQAKVPYRPPDEPLTHPEGKPRTPTHTLLAPPAISRPSLPRSTQSLPIYLRSAVGPSIAYMTAKRTLDILVSSISLALLMPLFVVIAALVKLTDG